ncbi:MAG: hypothetical protein ACXABO_15790 [Promethearchaeota archaeon]
MIQRNKTYANPFIFDVLQFQINGYFKLRLENGKTNIYINNELFIQCKYLLLTVPLDELEDLDVIDSIDKVAVKLNSKLESLDNRTNYISPTMQFWGHCSNLQVWYENNYDTRLIHSNLAFPLLKKLTEVGDPLARKKFKEEIAKRFEKGVINTAQYFLYEGYLNYLNKPELECVFYQLGFKLVDNIIIQLRDLMVSTLNNYRLIKNLLDLILFIDLKFNKNFLFAILKKIPHEFKQDLVKLTFFHLNYKEFRDYKIPYGKYYSYFEQFINYLYENFPHNNEILGIIDSGYFTSSISLDEKLAYGAVSYR